MTSQSQCDIVPNNIREMANSIPEETSGRLFLYLRQLRYLQKKGTDIVSSQGLAEACHVKSPTVRKDLSYFGEFGVRGVGYEVDGLINEIRSILSLDQTVRVALVGVGNLGKALLGFPGLEDEGFKIVAAFDADEHKIGQKINGVTVEDASRMAERIEAEDIRVAIMAVPASEAPAVAQQLAEASVNAVLSFAPCELDMPEGIRVFCVDLASEMARLVCCV